MVNLAGTVPHQPIYILGDGNFLSTSGVVKGSGTVDEPYVIEGWEISASSTSGIYIEDAQSYFVIQNVLIYGDGWYTGMRFVEDSHVKVRNCTIRDCEFGISALLCSDVDISNNSISGSDRRGMMFELTNSSLIDSNEVSGGEWGIGLLDCHGVDLGVNRVANCTSGLGATSCSSISVYSNSIESEVSAISITDSSYVTISCNEGADSTYGVVSIRCTESVIHRNNVSDNMVGILVTNESVDVVVDANIVAYDDFGIVCESNSTGTTLRGNAVLWSGYCGVLLEYAHRSTVFHNNLENNSGQGCDHEGTANSWDGGYPVGGNYWSNFQPTDVMNGDNQNLPGSDGISDISYNMIQSTATPDRYPLVMPHREPPIARAVYSASANYSGRIYVDASASEGWGYFEQALSYRWSWGDGGEWYPWSAVPYAEHTYSNPGDYEVRLEVMDTHGGVANVTLKVYVPHWDSRPSALLYISVALVAAVAASSLAWFFHRRRSDSTEVAQTTQQPGNDGSRGPVKPE
jgi:parallel beta-helix repeat protein